MLAPLTGFAPFNAGRASAPTTPLTEPAMNFRREGMETSRADLPHEVNQSASSSVK
jgi:hypothetical protein